MLEKEVKCKMKIQMKVIYDAKKDQNSEAEKKDDFLRSVFSKGMWRRLRSGGLEVVL